MITKSPSASAYRMSCLLLRVVLVILCAGSAATFVRAQTRTCQCEFSNKDYDAYGTNGACGIFMYNQARTCEVSFSGAGADSQVLRAVLGDQAVENQFTMASQIFTQYLAYAKEQRKANFLDPGFIEASLPVLERATVFRASLEKTGLPLKQIDSLFVDFSKKNSKQISATFDGAPPFKLALDNDIFYVGPGYVELNFRNIAKIRIVYFSDRPR